MTPYEQVEEQLQKGMTEGTMHVCLRDAGRLAGGFRATGSITQIELDDLEMLAVMKAKNGQEAKVKWREAVEYGRRDPIRPNKPKQPHEYGHFGFDDSPSIPSGKNQEPEPEPDRDVVIDERWVEPDEIPDPAADYLVNDTIRYLQALFQPEEKVGMVLDAWDKDGKWIPQRGFCGLTCAQLVDGLKKSVATGDFSGLDMDLHSEAGAWVRINPLNGEGVKDANVTDFRHSLIEADDQDLGKQLALIRKLQLPCAAIVHSGGKSIHAVVKVDAAGMEEYRKRVDRLYEVCAKNGLKVDNACRNPSRLSRLPGVKRGDRPQYLIATATGQPSWEAWEKYLEDETDELPDIERLSDWFFTPPPLPSALIDGILREGHKMRLSGPSKAGKSWSLIELTIALAEGLPWLGHSCGAGGVGVLYINLELGRASAYDRFITVYKALGIKPSALGMIDVWNLRGNSVPLSQLTPKLIRRAKGKQLHAIIFDPIYKVQHGDENDAGDIARFCNELDRIATELNCAVIDAHHHSKGAQGGKRSIDRASGSGVFGRDPDACLDLIELDMTDRRRAELEWVLVEQALQKVAAAKELDWAQVDITARDRKNPKNTTDGLILAFNGAFPDLADDALAVIAPARQKAAFQTGWRVEGTLREFATPAPTHVWFDWPLHPLDETGLLQDCKADGEAPPWEEAREAREDARRRKLKEDRAAMSEAVTDCGGHAKATVQGVAMALGVSTDTVERRLKRHPEWTFKKGLVLARESDEDAADED